jgi:hypothetical protein
MSVAYLIGSTIPVAVDFYLIAPLKPYTVSPACTRGARQDRLKAECPEVLANLQWSQAPATKQNPCTDNASEGFFSSGC